MPEVTVHLLDRQDYLERLSAIVRRKIRWLPCISYRPLPIRSVLTDNDLAQVLVVKGGAIAISSLPDD